MGRNIYVKVNGGAPVTLENWEGITFADLKAAMPDVSFENQRVVVRSTSADLRDDNAQIPLEGEQFIFCTPDKQNAGGYAEDKAFAKRCYAESDFGRTHFAGYPNMKAEVLAELVASYNTTEVATPSPTSAEVTVQDAIQSVYSALAVLESTLTSSVADTVVTVGGVALSQLNAEFDAFVAKTKARK